MSAGESARARVVELRAEVERISREAENWERGAVGEERTAAVLEAADEADWWLLHDRLLRPGETQTNIDHLVVTPSGIYLVDSKNWTGRISVYNDTLFAHWTTAEGRRSEPRARELVSVARMAAQVAVVGKCTVTPVLCLTGDAAGIAAPTAVSGVHVVPVGQLVAWLRARPASRSVMDARHLAVELSAHFPPAIGAGMTLGVSADAAKTLGQKGRRSQPRPSRRTRAITRAAVAIVGLVLSGWVGARLIPDFAHSPSGVGSALVAPAASTTTSAPSVSAATLQNLQAWRRHAGLYKEHAEPSTLPYIPDSALGSLSSTCRTDQTEISVFRGAFVHAPDAGLVSAARRYDHATSALLAACVAAHPKLLHRADAERQAAASDLNARYAEMLGEDPSSPLADRLL